jgi:hypothetical protein
MERTETRIEDFLVHEIENSDQIVATLNLKDSDEIPIFCECLSEMQPDPDRPGRLQLKNTGRKIHDGKIIIEAHNGTSANERLKDADRIDLSSILPSAGKFLPAMRPAPDPYDDPIVFYTFTVDAIQWDNLLQTLLSIKLIPL